MTERLIRRIFKWFIFLCFFITSIFKSAVNISHIDLSKILEAFLSLIHLILLFWSVQLIKQLVWIFSEASVSRGGPISICGIPEEASTDKGYLISLQIMHLKESIITGTSGLKKKKRQLLIGTPPRGCRIANKTKPNITLKLNNR